ncbi:MAG TPA: hypothetical protein VFW73_10475, partial [Lacipirellulaceae bacterium]|nr:hypothetical protein [Lacipirellulaceae bacterium]
MLWSTANWKRCNCVVSALLLLAANGAIDQARAQTFSVGANFTTITRQQTRTVSGFIIEPPDTMGAAGPNQFVEFNNGSFSIYSKSGSLISQVSDESFWTNALGTDPGGLTDPRVYYDPQSQRWFASMVTTDQTTNNKILIARSNTSDPTQGFKAVSSSTLSNRFADFPILGFDANGVYLTTNNFTSNDSFRSVSVYSVPKADLIASTPSLARATSGTALSPSTYGFSLQPAVDYGPKSASDPEPIMSIPNSASFSQYKFATLSGTTSAGATLSSVTNKSVQSVSNPAESPQPGTSNTIDNGDNRISSSVVQIGNYLYSVLSTPVSGRTAVRWTIADATTFSILQQGTISDPSLNYFYPSIAVNAMGDVVVGFSGSNSSTFASAYAVVGSSAGSVPGGTLTFGTPVQTKAGTDFYPDTRWGDYSAVTPDPVDPGIFWSHQEYAANRFTSGGTTNGNWATQASEIIPTKSGERRWSNTAGGDFSAGSNYFTGAAPAASDFVVFSRPSASYTVTASGPVATDRASVRQGNVIWDLTGGSYTLSNSNAATPSLAVGEFQGTAALAVSGGALNTMNAAIGGTAVGSGALTLNANSNWTNSDSVIVGAAGAGTLTIKSLSTAYLGANLSIGDFGMVNLDGGTLRFDGYSRAPGGTVGFASGTVQVAGNRTIDNDTAIVDFFGPAPTIGLDKKLVVEGSATISTAAPLTLAGGTLAANSLTLASGSQVACTQSSYALAPVAAQAGSIIDVTAGELAMGDATNVNGFYSNGALHVGSNSVTLHDADGAVFDAAAQVTLGDAPNPGTLSAANGLTINAGGNISGHGLIDTPNSSATPIVNNGSINGDAMAEPLTLPGFVAGSGSLDNVKFTGTYSPGEGPATVSVGSAEYDGTLDVEIGGQTPGTEYDQINHVLGNGT